VESPTFTVSSGSRDRDTPKSSISESTDPTSLADSFGYLRRDRDRDREGELEMMREMKERHGTEMGALLGALSDSQRTVRVLREENSDLRDRLERFAVAIQTSQELRRVCEDLQSECGSLRKENADMRKELVGMSGLTQGGGSGVRTPVPKTAMNNDGSSPLG
jgi:predicted RNase H-like nuclease (RuvC/YqgF family)